MHGTQSAPHVPRHKPGKAMTAVATRGRLPGRMPEKCKPEVRVGAARPKRTVGFQACIQKMARKMPMLLWLFGPAADRP